MCWEGEQSIAIWTCAAKIKGSCPKPNVAASASVVALRNLSIVQEHLVKGIENRKEETLLHCDVSLYALMTLHSIAGCVKKKTGSSWVWRQFFL